MMFRLIRYCLLLILLACSVWGILRGKAKRKKLAIVSAAIISVMVVSLSSVFPIENLFVSFNDPESLFQYFNGSQVQSVLDGNDSCMVIYRKGGNNGGFVLFPKSKKGYKIPTPFLTEKVLDRLDGNGVVEVYHVKGCADYYLFVSIPANGEIDDVFFFDESKDRDRTINYKLERNSGFLYIYASFNKSPLGYSMFIADRSIVI